MSLRVWLPLNGTLDNQGLDDIVVTNNGATVDNNGKIGKCYSFDGNDDYIQLTNFNMSNMSEFSISCWIKPTSSNLNSYLFLVRGNGSHQIRLSGDGFCFRDNHHSSQIVVSFEEPFLENIWMHISCVYKKGIIYLYQNGIQTKMANYYHEDSQTNSANTEIRIGRIQSSTGNSYFTGHINDFRIYDHALSPMEVKQISQGLILHYPLNNNGWGQENLLINSNIEKSGKSNVAQWFRWNITDSPLVTNQYYTLSFDAKITVPTDVFYISFAQNDSTQEIFQQGVQVISEYKRYIFTGKTTKTNINSIVISNYKNYGRGNGNNTTGTLYIKNMKLELGQKATPWCPNEADELYNKLEINSNIQYDTSGYCNNGVKTGNFQYDNDTPKYNVSAIFNGADNCIQIGNLYSIFSNPFSINLWFKKEVIGSKKYETLIGGASGFEMDTRNGASQTLSLYMTSTRGGNVYSPFEFNNWYMITMVNNGTHELYYINGILTKTINKKNMPNSNYYIGAWNTPTQQNFKGNMSDVRIYCTALSAEDILSLYNNSAYIDNQGNIYGAIYEEV